MVGAVDAVDDLGENRRPAMNGRLVCEAGMRNDSRVSSMLIRASKRSMRHTHLDLSLADDGATGGDQTMLRRRRRTEAPSVTEFDRSMM